MNLAIFGSRTIPESDQPLILDILKKSSLVRSLGGIVSGGARGADTIAEGIADDLGLIRYIYHAEWDKYGKRAGMIRNSDIAETADIGLAIVDKPIVQSIGTYDTYKKMLALGKKVIVVRKENNVYRIEK